MVNLKIGTVSTVSILLKGKQVHEWFQFMVFVQLRQHVWYLCKHKSLDNLAILPSTNLERTLYDCSIPKIKNNKIVKFCFPRRYSHRLLTVRHLVSHH